MQLPSVPGNIFKLQNLDAPSPDPSASVLSIIAHFLPLHVTILAPYFSLVLYFLPQLVITAACIKIIVPDFLTYPGFYMLRLVLQEYN